MPFCFTRNAISARIHWTKTKIQQSIIQEFNFPLLSLWNNVKEGKKEWHTVSDSNDCWNKWNELVRSEK